MEDLRRELLLISRARDTGNAMDQGEWITVYLDALLMSLTPLAIESFDAEALRVGYVAFITEVRSGGLEFARANLVYHIGISHTARAQSVRTPRDPHVVSITKGKKKKN